MVFNRNGLALIQVHLGNHLPEALDLVDDGLAELDRELDRRGIPAAPVCSPLQPRTGLRGSGTPDDALADYTAVIGEDPNYPEYYFDRGNLLRRVGRDDEALADYEAAIRLSPPFPEVYYNRADVKYSIGD